MINEIKIKIISNIKVILAEKQITLLFLSKETGISYGHLNKWVNGYVQMSLDNIALICQVLDIKDLNSILKIVEIEKKNLIDLKVS